MKKILLAALLGAAALLLGCKADVDMDVHVTKVSLSSSSVNLITGSTHQLNAVISPQDATNPNISFSSDNEAVATVDGEGLISAGTPGTAVITVTTEDGEHTDECIVYVSAAPVSPTGVSLDRTTLTLAIDGTDILEATVAPANANNKTVRWTSSDTDVVTVSEVGGLTGIAAGTATVTVTTASKGFTATCDITVLDAFTVSLDTGVGPDIDNQIILDGGTVTQPDDPEQNGYTFDGWYTDDTYSSTFDFTTTITGNTTIYAKWNIITYTISDTIFSSTYSGSNPVTGAIPDTYTVESNDVVFGNLSCSGLIFLGWFTDETYTEQLLGIPSGSSGNISVYAKWEEDIADDGTGIMLNTNRLILKNGTSCNLTTYLLPTLAQSFGTLVEWDIDNDSIATITNGHVSAKAIGSATITASSIISGTEYSTQCSLVVVDETGLLGISLNNVKMAIEENTSSAINLSTNNNANVITSDTVWKSSNPDIATIDSSWNITGHAEGKATISATSVEGGFTETCTVHVYGEDDLWSDIVEVMEYVPAGTFQRDADSGNTSTISNPFYMGRYEVSRLQFLLIMGVDPATNNGYSSSLYTPTNEVNWYRAITFCNKLSLEEGLDPVYSVAGVDFATISYTGVPVVPNAVWNAVEADWEANGYRLPTEMEWKWAAIGADSQDPGETNTTGYLKDFSGDDGTNSLTSHAWVIRNASTKMHECGLLFPNELGIYDMSGNVWEWCWDKSAELSDGPLTDYRGGDTGENRTLHRAAFNSADATCELIKHSNAGQPAYSKDFAWGFRVVRNADTN